MSIQQQYLELRKEKTRLENKGQNLDYMNLCYRLNLLEEDIIREELGVTMAELRETLVLRLIEDREKIQKELENLKRK